MAKKGGAPENLDPVRTKEEARKRGKNGGIASGEARRKKRDAKNAINLLLNMAAKGNLDKNLMELGVEEEDRTNMVALQARIFTLAMSGDMKAYQELMRLSGNDPEENRRERVSKEEAKRRTLETNARINAMEMKANGGMYVGDEDDFDADEVEDVIIMLPDNGRPMPPSVKSQPAPDITPDGEVKGDDGEEEKEV